MGENFSLSVAIRERFLRKSIFKQLDTALVGVVQWITINLCFSPKSIFKQ